MREQDFDTFCKLLDAAYELHSKTLTANAKALFFASLKNHPLDVVRGAFSSHVSDKVNGRFPPQPAHLIAHIDAMNGCGSRPGAEEAWALAINAGDELQTVVWTAEMRDAFAICWPVLEKGDEIGARMAFKEAYARLVAEALRNGQPCKWEVSPGWDNDKREKALGDAVRCGRLTYESVAQFLPAPKEIGSLAPALFQSTKLLLEHRGEPAEPSADIAEKIAEVKRALAKSTDQRNSARAEAMRLERDRIEGLKRKSQASVDALRAI